MLPTGKEHISYSELKCWKECSFRHKLKHIDKIDMFEPSPFLDFGTAVHNGAESFLRTGKVPREKLLKDIHTAWEKYGFDDPQWVKKQPGWYKYYPVEEWCEWALHMWDDIPLFLDEEFPGWERVSAEEELYEPIEGRQASFKGYIDAIIKVPRKNGTYKYWILDWKTAKSYGWDSRKKKDFLIQAQVILYKHYWASKNQIPLKDVGCGFILLKRNGTPGKMCDFLKINSGPKALEKSLKMVKNMLSSLNRRFFLKNRTSCKFCDYHDTEHCP